VISLKCTKYNETEKTYTPAMEEDFSKWVGTSQRRVQSKHTPTLDTRTISPMASKVRPWSAHFLQPCYTHISHKNPGLFALLFSAREKNGQTSGEVGLKISLFEKISTF